MKVQDAAKLRETLAECSQEVFRACNITASLAQNDDETHSEGRDQKLAAFIGFSGPVVRGTLTLVAPVTTIRQAYPLALAADAPWEQEVFDWAGEIANQLLGRVKNKLVSRGVELHASTPKTMFAEHLHVTKSLRAGGSMLSFSTGDDKISIWFDAVVEDGAELFGPVIVAEECAAEGEMVLF